MLLQYNNSVNELNPPLFIIIFGANNESTEWNNFSRGLFKVTALHTFSASHLWRRHPVVVIWHFSLGTFFLISDEFRGFSHVTFLSRYCPMHAQRCSSRLKATYLQSHSLHQATAMKSFMRLWYKQRCMCFHFISNPFHPFLSLFQFECV